MAFSISVFSRAIVQYLANAYGKDTDLYPTDPKKRAMIDQMLYFDSGTLYDRLGKYVVSINESTFKQIHPPFTKN
jgi:glutathione S-transferase